MATNGGSINYTVKYNIDKTGLNQMKASLQEIFNLSKQDLIKINSKATDADLAKLKASAKEVESALERAFNPNLGTLNVSKFNQELKKLDVKRIYQDFNIMGQAGRNAFRNITSDVLTTNMQLKQTHSILDNMATTMANTIKWGVASSIMNSFTGSVQQAYGYVKNLDGSLNDIRIVTGKSADEMAKFAVQANKAAKELGASTTSYTDASLIYYQQGLTDAEVAARAEVTLKAANVTGQSADAVSEQLTAVWNGYKVSAEEAELYIDKLAAVAATTASDLEELSVGMSKVASAANLMGVDVDQLNAQLATIVAVTRQAPESVGTALKTIYARMGDIEAGLDGETSLGNYTEKMAEMGYNVLDANGKLRDMGEVIEEIGGNWKNMSREQQISLSQTMAGTRQYNNLLSLFDNWDMYTKALETSGDAAGTLQEQQDIYMDRTVAHLQQLRTETEDLYDSLFETKSFNNLLDGITGAVNLLGNFVDAIGGGGNVLLALGSIGSKVFSKQLAGGIATFITNMQTAKNNATQLRAELEILNQYEGANVNDERTKVLVDMKRQILDLNKNITIEERNIANEYIKQQNELFKQQDALEARKKAAEDTYRTTVGSTSKLSINNPNDAKIMAQDLRAKAGELRDVEVNWGSVDGISQAYAEINQALQSWKLSGDDATKVGKSLTETENELTIAVEKHEKAILEQLEVAKRTAANDDIEEKNKKELIEALEKLEKLRSADGTYNLKNAQVAKQFQKVEEARVKAFKNQATANEKAADAMDGFADATKKAQENTEQLQSSYRGFISQLNLRDKIQQGIHLASSFGQVASAISSIQNLGSIWKNDDLTSGEKLLQTITNLGFALPMLANSLGQVGKVLGVNTAFTNAYTAAQMANKLSMTTLTAATAAGATAEQARNLAILATMGTETARINVEEIILALSEHKIGTEMAEILINEALAESNIIVGESAIFAGQGFKTFLAALGPVGWAVIGLTAAFAAFKIIDLFTVSAKEAGEALTESISSYKELENELSSLENQLSTTKDRLYELMQLAEKGELSLTEEEELTRLKAQTVELENQIELLEKQQELKEREIARDANKAYEKGTYDDNKGDDKLFAGFTETQTVTTDDGNGNISTEEVETHYLQSYSAKGVGLDDSNFKVKKDQIELGDTSTFETWKQSMEDLYAEAITNAEATEGKESKGWEKVAQQIKSDLNATKEFYEQERDAYLKGLQEGYDKAQEVLPALKAQNEDGRYDDTIAYYENIVRDYQEQQGTLDNTVNKVFGESGLNLDKDTALDLQTSSDVINEETKKLDEQELTKIIGESGVKQLKIYSEELGMSMYDLVATYQNINGLVGKSGKELDDALAEIRAQKEEELVTQTNEKFENTDLGDNQTITTEDIQKSGFTAEDLQNWDKILEYLDTNIVKTEGWQSALKEAKAEYEEINTLLKSNQTLATAAENYDLDVEELKAYRDLLLETNPALKENQEGLDAIVIANKRMEKGVKEIASNWEDFNEIMSNSAASGEDVSSIMPEIESALQDILNLNTEDFQLLPADFAQKHWDLINDVTNGVEGAVDELRNVASQEILLDVVGEADFSKVDEDLAELHQKILDFDNESFEVGIAIDPEDHAEFFTSCNELINAAKMSAEQAQAYFASMGYDAEVEKIEVPPDAHPWNVTSPILDKEATELSGVPVFKEDKLELDGVNYSGGGTALALKTITPAGSYGGNVNVKTTAPKNSIAPKTEKKSGGSKKTEKEPDKMDSFKEEIDIFHDIDIEIERLSRSLERLNKQQEKLFGKKLIDNLNEQLSVLDKQIAAQKEKIKLAEKEAEKIKKNLSKQGVKFNKDGTISNYVRMLEESERRVNNAIDRYNSMSAEEQEDYKDSIENEKKRHENLKKDIGKYEELIHDTIPELTDEIQEEIDRKIEIQIQKFTMEVEIRLEMAEAERDWNEFKKKVLDGFDDDDPIGNALAAMADFSSYYKDSNTGEVQILTQHLNRTLEEYQKLQATGWSDVYGDNEAQLLEDLEKYRTALQEALLNAQETVETVKEAYLDMIDLANEKFEEHIQQYETITDIIDQNVNLIKLLDGEDAYKSLGIYYKMQKENNLQQLDFQRQEVELWRQRMDGAEQGSEEWLAYREQWQAAVKDLNDTVASSIENLIAEYQNTVQSIFKDLNDKLTKGKGLEYVQEEWDLINKEAERYLDSVNATFEIQQLQYKYIDALNNTDSLHTQNKLNNLMNEQLEMLREKDKLTQYDVDRANLLYEIELKRIALEEAQRNKSEMRLRRDAQGNYSYQYVANKDKINEAQRELGAAQNELWNLDKEAYTGNLDDFNSIMSEFQESYAKLMSDQTLSEEEKERRKVLLQEHYGNIINQIIAENENIRYNLSAASIDAFADYQGTIIMENLVPQWNSGIQEMIDSFIAEGGFLPSCQGAFNQLDEATKIYQDSLKDLEKTAGMNFSNIRLGIDESIAHTQAFIEKNEDLIAEYDKELDRIEEIYKEVKKLITKYEESEKAAKKAAKAAYEFAQAAREAAAAAAAMNSAAGGGGSFSSGSGGRGSSSGSGGRGSSSGGKTPSSNGNTPTASKNTTSGYHVVLSGDGRDGKKYTIKDSNGNTVVAADGHREVSLTEAEARRYYGITTGFATGGYTGKWVDGDKKGKLAFLHQKELVLNAKDTSNILTAVKSVRSMQDILSALNTSMQARTGSLLSDLLNHRNNLNNGNNIVQQKVYIEAKFEGQTESAQIEKALDNLVNYASQYAFASSRF